MVSFFTFRQWLWLTLWRIRQLKHKQLTSYKQLFVSYNVYVQCTMLAYIYIYIGPQAWHYRIFKRIKKIVCDIVLNIFHLYIITLYEFMQFFIFFLLLIESSSSANILLSLSIKDIHYMQNNQVKYGTNNDNDLITINKI